MPGPIPLRNLPAMHQRRFASIDDEKISVSMTSSPASSSPLDHVSPIPISVAQKRSRQEVQRLVKEAMAISAQPQSAASFSPQHADISVKRGFSSSSFEKASRSRLQERLLEKAAEQRVADASSADIRDGQVICVEIAGSGAQWKYMAKQQKTGSIFHIVDTKSDQNPFANLVAFARTCLVPEGYPESVAPSYTPYMQWRALKYFFGGAMSVFTTRSLLHAVGVSGQGAASTAVAVNWVIKDGAGRIGKMLFARHGKKFDCDMKQLRFRGDLLMELGAAVELATVAAPHLFLPLACAANVAKNIAAVTSTSTRASIYKAFARGENIGDVTAKGECISNVADLLGTGLGILISKKNPSLTATFMVLSCGYLFSSYQEIKSVQLPTLNRARFKVAVQSFLDTGRVPSLSEGNQKETIFMHPWVSEKPYILGARVNEAFQSSHNFLDLLPLFQKEKYLVTYNSTKKQAYVVLKEKASSDDVMRGAFHAQMLVNSLQRSSSQNQGSGNYTDTDSLTEYKRCYGSDMGIEAAIRESCKHISGLFEEFKYQATSQGWIMAESLLNPANARLSYWREA